MNMNATKVEQNNSKNSTDFEDKDDDEIAGEIEDVIEYLLQGLKDKDSVVRLV